MPVFLARNAWDLRTTVEEWPKLRFSGNPRAELSGRDESARAVGAARGKSRDGRHGGHVSLDIPPQQAVAVARARISSAICATQGWRRP